MSNKCRYCNGLKKWEGDSPLPEPLQYGDIGVDELHCGYEGAQNYADRIGCVLGQDGNQITATIKDFINLEESPCGFGDTALIAMADLCKQLGYKPSKMWGSNFKDLLQS